MLLFKRNLLDQACILWFIDGSETIKNGAKEQKGEFLGMLLGTLGTILLGNLLTCKGVQWRSIPERRVIRVGEGKIRTGEGTATAG